jgi:hypothetical protein
LALNRRRWAQRILQCAGHCEQTIGDKASSVTMPLRITRSVCKGIVVLR